MSCAPASWVRRPIPGSDESSRCGGRLLDTAAAASGSVSGLRWERFGDSICTAEQAASHHATEWDDAFPTPDVEPEQPQGERCAFRRAWQQGTRRV